MSLELMPNPVEATTIPGSGSVRLSSLWTLFTLTLRQHLHGKRWIVMALLAIIPAVLVILARGTSRNVPGMFLEFSFGFMLIPQVILPLIALVYASGILQDEQEEQTITYLLIRPIPKWALYPVKLAATLVTAVVVTAGLTILTYAAIYVGDTTHTENVAARCATAIAVHSLAVMTYCCLFGLVSMITKRTLIAGIVYMAVVEGVFGNLAFGIRLITVIYYTRLIAYPILPFVVTRGVNIGMPESENLSAAAWQLDIVSDPQLKEHPSFYACLLVLFAASLIFTALAAVICASKEFHVKTPEKP